MVRTWFAALPAIYDAALSPEHWPRALASFSREINSVGAILVAVDQVELPFHIETASYPMEQVRYYFENFGHYDEPIMSRTLLATPPLHILRDSDVWGDIHKLEDRPDYKYLREQYGARRRAGVRLSSNKGWTDLLALQFDKDWSEQPQGFDEPIHALLPHLAKAVEINRHFSILRARYQAVLSALDHVRIGTCVVSETGAVILANREARRIHDLNDGLQISQGQKIVCRSGEATAEVSAKVHAAIATSAGEGSDPELLMFAPRTSGKRPFMVEVAPLRDSLGELEVGLRGAIVYVVDLENQRSVSTRRLSQLFALTETESEIGRQMVGGQSAAEIAKSRGVSEETVRSQFKAVYSKTGVRRRADLVRLALTIDPPIGDAE